MHTDTAYIRFRLPVTRDTAAQILRHTAREGSRRFKILCHESEYLRIQTPCGFRANITIDILCLPRPDSGTLVLAVDVTREPRVAIDGQQFVAALLEQFKLDAEHFATTLQTRKSWRFLPSS